MQRFATVPHEDVIGMLNRAWVEVKDAQVLWEGADSVCHFTIPIVRNSLVRIPENELIETAVAKIQKVLRQRGHHIA